MSTVESNRRRATSTGPAAVATPLRADPGRGIGIPVVARIGELAERGFDLVPASLVFQPPPDELTDERAPSARADTSVELCDELVVQGYVQTHVLTLAHSLPTRPPGHGLS